MSAKRVAIIGASSDRSKYGNKAVRAYKQQGWTVFPVNPRGGQIEGLPAYPALRDVPGPLDLVSIYVPPDVGIELLPDIAAANPAEFMVNPGAESDEFLAAAQRLGLSPQLTCSIIAVGLTPSSV